MKDNWYDTAQICINGHPINSRAASWPQHNMDFCDKCGASTITNCPNCNAPIKGVYHSPDDLIPANRSACKRFKPPPFCENCGKQYPWTEAKLKAAKELSDEIDNLNPEERELLKKSLDDIVRETPQTTVAVNRFKKLVAKAGKPAADAFRDILVDIVSEAIKKTIWP